MKKILITGGAGFIGSHLALKLAELGYLVTVLDNLSPQIHTKNPEINSPLYLRIKDKTNFIQGDVSIKSQLSSAIQNNEIIVHLAAETGTGQSMYEISKYNDVNIGGTANLLDILTNDKHSVAKVIVASSRSIYGEGKYKSNLYGVVYPEHRREQDLKEGKFELTYQDDDNIELLATDENSAIHPSSFYAITKQVQEQMIMTMSPYIGINAISLRFQNVYGPGQSLSNPYTGILSIFSNLILSDKQVNIFEDGLESRDFVYIDDVVEAIYRAIINENANGEILNVGSGINTSVIDIAKLLYSYYNKEENYFISGNYRLGDIRHNYANISKLKSILNFQPNISINEGLKYFAKWVLTQNIIENNYENSILEMKNKGLLK